MSDTIEERIEQASAAKEEEIAFFVHDTSPRVVKALLANRNIGEQDALIIANRKNLPGDVLETIAKDKRWAASYPIRLALAKNPKTPLFIALSISRYLRLFDLAEIGRSHFLPLTFRHKIENIIMEKIPTMPLGIKRTLAKISSGNVLLTMMQDRDADVVKTCLDNPHLVEAHLFKVVIRHDAFPGTIRMISEHQKWSSRYAIRLALVKNNHTPLARSVRFLEDIKTPDLKELYADTSAPTGIKPYIHNELMGRGADLRKEEKRVYEIGGPGADEQDVELEAPDNESTPDS
jgi:hypothetical protein